MIGGWIAAAAGDKNRLCCVDILNCGIAIVVFTTSLEGDDDGGGGVVDEYLSRRLSCERVLPRKDSILARK